jgi:hypothetical protein
MLCGEGKLAFSKATPDEAKAWAKEAFDARVALEAAPLVRRGGEVELDRARTLVVNAAGALLQFLKRSGWKPVDAEREVNGTFAGLPAFGLVVERTASRRSSTSSSGYARAGGRPRLTASRLAHRKAAACPVRLLHPERFSSSPPSRRLRAPGGEGRREGFRWQQVMARACCGSPTADCRRSPL